MEQTAEKAKAIIIQRVPLEAHKKLKIYCAHKGTTMRQTILDMIDETIENDKEPMFVK